VKAASYISACNQTGFPAGVLVNIASKFIDFRLEDLNSQQRYGFSTDSSAGSFTNNYVSMSELATINITRFVRLQFGGLTGYLLNARSTSNNQSSWNATTDQVLSYYNRFDYGYRF
jgi:hypothetical protein